MKKEELSIEKEKLKNTISIIDNLLEEEKEDLNDLIDNYEGQIEQLWRMTDEKKVHIKNLVESLDKPYFARIDFKNDDDNQKQSFYIGKNGVIKDSNIIVTDWRAPISSLYYSSELGRASYEAPDGTMTGDLSLKRQYEIDSGKLIDFFDVDLVSNDDLLQKYLNTNNDARLKNIVSTIQKEQNEVIRKKFGENLIVQGVAGSGKTTVALHRIAYLVYNYIDHIKQNQHLVIGPNPVFLKYTKSVLPELDVSGVRQYTYETFAQKYIKDDSIVIDTSDKKVTKSILNKNNVDVDKFKCSMKYKKMLEEFMKLYFYKVTSMPLMIGDFEVLSQNEIADIFNSTSGVFYNNLNSRIENTVDRVCDYIDNNKSEISSRYASYSYELFEKANTEQEKNEMRKKFSKERKELDKNCRTTTRKYFNKSKIESKSIYKLFINTIDDFDMYNYKNLNTLKKNTLNSIKTNTFDFEDLAALIYITSLISPQKEFEQIRHVTIDEAQDFGEFNFYALKKALPKATFSIYGDIAQSIYDYRSIDNWDEVNDVMFDKSGEIVKFNKSYRTTSEIMNAADDVSDRLGLGRSELVVRHGPEISISNIDDEKEMALNIARKINEYKNKGYKTIAVISKTDELSKQMNEELDKLGVNIPNVTIDDDLTSDKFSVCTISNQLSKGLEFDAVIINNANEDIYSSNNSLDMKLLYVAITRALHELDITYTGKITKALEHQLNNKKQNHQKVVEKAR